MSPEKRKVVVNNINNRARRRGQFGRIQTGDLIKLIVKQKSRCFYCGRLVKFYDDNHDKEDAVSFDHVIPMARGGSNTPDNLVMCCVGCNRERNHQDQVRENGSKP